MISNLEKEITFRYLKTRKKDGFLNIITIFSFIGISLGVAVLIIVMSVMNGFRSDLIKKINGFNSHATIQNYDGIFDLKKIDTSNEVRTPRVVEWSSLARTCGDLLGQVVRIPTTIL